MIITGKYSKFTVNWEELIKVELLWNFEHFHIFIGLYCSYDVITHLFFVLVHRVDRLVLI